MASHNDNKDKTGYSLSYMLQREEITTTEDFMAGIETISQEAVCIEDEDGKEVTFGDKNQDDGKYSITIGDYDVDYIEFSIKTNSKDFLDGVIYGIDFMKIPHQLFNTYDNKIAITGIVSIFVDGIQIDPKTLYPQWTIVDAKNYDFKTKTWTSTEENIPNYTNKNS